MGIQTQETLQSSKTHPLIQSISKQKNAKNSKCQLNAKTLIALAVAANPALRSAVPTKPAVVVAAMDAVAVTVAAILNAANDQIKKKMMSFIFQFSSRFI